MRNFNQDRDVQRSRAKDDIERQTVPEIKGHGAGSAGETEERTPGTAGRPMNRRAIQEDEVNTDDVAASPNDGGNSGGTRSPKVLQRNRKLRLAA